MTDSIKYVMGKNLMKKFLFGAFAAVCAAFSLAAVNINTASSVELEALPGIGPAKAKSIVEKISLTVNCRIRRPEAEPFAGSG